MKINKPLSAMNFEDIRRILNGYDSYQVIFRNHSILEHIQNLRNVRRIRQKLDEVTCLSKLVSIITKAWRAYCKMALLSLAGILKSFEYHLYISEENGDTSEIKYFSSQFQFLFNNISNFYFNLFFL